MMPEALRVQFALTELLLRSTDEEAQEQALEALSEVESIGKEQFFEKIEALQNIEIKVMLMKFWLLVNEPERETLEVTQ